ncbi:MAG: hypothetical protein HWN67_03430 [Candidatus Helarchaeota archaeon]|nr:hypothetical protein [Candidatus Helarchaeota archaeon]
MLVNLETEKIAKVGIPTTSSSTFNMNELEEEQIDITWGGLRLYIKRPCKKELIISKSDIFYNGLFENGIYKRLRNIPISRRVVPSIGSRINYFIRANLSLINNKTKQEENFFSDGSIVIKPAATEPISSHPIDVKIKGVAINISKDSFKPEEAIEMEYTLDNYRDIQVELIQDITTICQCPEFWKTCVHNKKKPPIQRAVSNIKNPPTNGTLILKIPKDSEPSHNYLYETQVSLGVKHRIGDENNWYLKIEATSFTSEKTQFTIPINIIKGRTEETDFFAPSVGEKGKALGAKIIIGKEIGISSKVIDGNIINLSLKNNSKYNFEGVTIQITGIKEFFEMPPKMLGKIKWDSNQLINISYDKFSSDLTSIQLKIEDNNQNTVSKNISL